MSKKEDLPFDGLIGTGTNLINPNVEDFQGRRDKIAEQAARHSDEQKMHTKIRGVTYRMESYLADQRPGDMGSVGSFLKELVEIIGVSHKAFATYIGYQNTNLSALYNGSRRINHDLALKLGHIFDMDPALWLHLQNKWELQQIQQEKPQTYQQYQLKDLLRKAG